MLAAAACLCSFEVVSALGFAASLRAVAASAAAAASKILCLKSSGVAACGVRAGREGALEQIRRRSRDWGVAGVHVSCYDALRHPFYSAFEVSVARMWCGRSCSCCSLPPLQSSRFDVAYSSCVERGGVQAGYPELERLLARKRSPIGVDRSETRRCELCRARRTKREL